MEIRFDQKTIFFVTGAYGHLGNVVIRDLLNRGARIRALIHPSDLSDERFNFPVELYRGDLRSRESIKAAFIHQPDEQLVVIHLASLISTFKGGFNRLYRTNVVGTKNLLELAVANNAIRFLYVSSVHALTEPPLGVINHERTDFNPNFVKGTYAKSKAMASQLVLSYMNKLDVVMVHPSGIIGPFDYRHSPTNQVFFDYLNGKLPLIIKGGYDFVDVRDVSSGIINALLNGKRGENYILSGAYTTIENMIGILSKIAKNKAPKVLPLWIAIIVAPFVEAWAKMSKRQPLFTPYSLYTTRSNGLFSHEKARVAFDYCPRPLADSLKDIYEWYFDSVMHPKRLKQHKKRYL
jgi:dihydroflavonol-4-reductase